MQLKNPLQFPGEQEVVGQHHNSKLSLIAGESLGPMHTRIPTKVESYRSDYLALR